MRGKIAAACGDLDSEKAYVLGLLHDIGRTFGVRHLGHVSDGYSYMKKIGCDEVAKVCLTHSFATQTLEEYIGKYDVSEEELSLIQTELENRFTTITTGWFSCATALPERRACLT